MAEKLTKSGKPDKRFKANKVVEVPEPLMRGGKIQEIIDSKQAPGIAIPPQHQSAPKPGAGVDPNRPLDWSNLNQNGKTADVLGG